MLTKHLKLIFFCFFSLLNWIYIVFPLSWKSFKMEKNVKMTFEINLHIFNATIQYKYIECSIEFSTKYVCHSFTNIIVTEKNTWNIYYSLLSQLTIVRCNMYCERRCEKNKRTSIVIWIEYSTCREGKREWRTFMR